MRQCDLPVALVQHLYRDTLATEVEWERADIHAPNRDGRPCPRAWARFIRGAPPGPPAAAAPQGRSSQTGDSGRSVRPGPPTATLHPRGPKTDPGAAPPERPESPAGGAPGEAGHLPRGQGIVMPRQRQHPSQLPQPRPALHSGGGNRSHGLEGGEGAASHRCRRMGHMPFLRVARLGFRSKGELSSPDPSRSAGDRLSWAVVADHRWAGPGPPSSEAGGRDRER